MKPPKLLVTQAVQLHSFAFQAPARSAQAIHQCPLQQASRLGLVLIACFVLRWTAGAAAGAHVWLPGGPGCLQAHVPRELHPALRLHAGRAADPSSEEDSMVLMKLDQKSITFDGFRQLQSN